VGGRRRMPRFSSTSRSIRIQPDELPADTGGQCLGHVLCQVESRDVEHGVSRLDGHHCQGHRDMRLALPPKGGPSSKTPACSATKRAVARSRMSGLGNRGLKDQSKLSRSLTPGMCDCFRRRAKSRSRRFASSFYKQFQEIRVGKMMVDGFLVTGIQGGFFPKTFVVKLCLPVEILDLWR